jgi:hypothetical protein
MADDNNAAAAALNTALAIRRRQRLEVSGSTNAGMNAFMAGRSMAPEPDPELDALLALKDSDVVAYYGLPLDVRARCERYVQDLALAADQGASGTGQ